VSEQAARAELAARWGAPTLEQAAAEEETALTAAQHRLAAELVEELAAYNVAAANPRPANRYGQTRAAVLTLSKEGLSLRQTAAWLGVRPDTVAAHRRSLRAAGETWPRLTGGGSTDGHRRRPGWLR
jgi:hypothetical protein